MFRDAAVIRHKLSVSCAVVLGYGLVLALGLAMAGTPSPGGFDPQTARALQQALDQARVYLAEPGAVLLVEDPKGAQWLGASGVSRIDSLRPGPDEDPWQGPAMRPDMHFRIASVTKTFTATVVLQLVGEGKCSLDDTVEKILGDIVPGSGQITLRMLLGMTSGLFNYVADPDFFRDLLAKPLKSYTPQELISIANRASGDKLVFEPGASWKYCNTNYILLGMVIEKLTAQSYHQAINERIIKPLGLEHTMTPAPDHTGLPTPYVHGYFFDGETRDRFQDITAQNPTAAWSAGGMISTAGDLVKWLGALASGRLLREPQRRAMFTWAPVGRNHGFQDYGLGVSKYCGAVGHIGSLPGYRACIYHYKGYNFVVLLNGYRTVTKHKGHYALYVLKKAAEAVGVPLEETGKGD